MSGFCFVAKTSAICSGAAGIIGYCVGGAPLAKEAAKATFALTTQAAILSKGEEAADALGDKVSKRLDQAGEKIEAIADKTGESIQKVCDITGQCFEKMADVSSKIILTGYTINLGLTASITSMENLKKFCPEGIFQSMNCASMSASNFAMNAIVVWSGIAIAKQIYNNVYK